MTDSNPPISSPASWRLFLDRAHSGARNMAIDEAMLLAHARGEAPPTLRFYSWNPSCLSLGRLQKQLPTSIAGERAGESERAGENFDIVRRPTGGRAVWHEREITYCAVVRAELLPIECRSVEGAYNWLSAGFLLGLQSLGLPVSLAPGGVRTNGANCFAASASCDFVANGKKLIGAAQCRKDDTILQHGSLLLSIDPRNWQRAGETSAQNGVAKNGGMDGATSLAELGLELSQGEIIAALCSGFTAQNGIEWQKDGLSSLETAWAEVLWREKYATSEWTFGAKLAEESTVAIEAMMSQARATEIVDVR